MLVLLTEAWFGVLGKHIRRTPTYNVEVQYNEKTSLDGMLRFCKDSHMAIINLKIHTLEEGSEAKYIAAVTLRGSTACEEPLEQVRGMPGIVNASGV